VPITREVRSPKRVNGSDRSVCDLRALSASERLFLWRHRRAVHGRALTQGEAAVRLGIPRSLYNRLENGGRSRLSVEEALRLPRDALDLEPTLAELCFIARRRAGRRLSWLENRLGVSRPTFHALERSGDGRIVTLWEELGFSFG
jgi:DNA-binding XRE family transcriptional regulator